VRVRQLDILRAIAVLLVLGRHEHANALWRRCGWVGVDLFFVLSGFLISGLLFSEYKKRGRLDLPRFYIRRGLKIYPSFYVLILATFLVSMHFGRMNGFRKSSFSKTTFTAFGDTPGRWPSKNIFIYCSASYCCS
jgi:peptidoglycan/LPS O-acetylase OafA/YrhL